MSKLDQLKSLLEAKGLLAKKGLGQNFLVDQGALDKIVAAADLTKSDKVIEVGPGTGFLTEQLIAQAAQVISVELDKNMVEILGEIFKFADNLEVVNEDILDFRIPDGPYKVVANIPYNITSPLLKHFLQDDNQPSLMVVLVQKEVAEKVCGISGKSLITIETQLFGEPEIVSEVKAASFFPVPKVDSAILKIRVHDKPLIGAEELSDFLRIVKFGFSQKRKKLSNSLAAGLHKEPSEVRELLERARISPEVRAEELEISDWKRLVGVLF